MDTQELGDTVSEQEGDDHFAAVKRIRHTSVQPNRSSLCGGARRA
jgi:hypothetical protein